MFRSPGWKKLAILDQLIKNRDRKSDNLLVWQNDSTQIVAIDHGCSLCLERPNDATIAYRYFQNNPDVAQLSSAERHNLELLIASGDHLYRSLPPDMQIRVDDMLKTADTMLTANSLLIT